MTQIHVCLSIKPILYTIKKNSDSLTKILLLQNRLSYGHIYVFI